MGINWASTGTVKPFQLSGGSQIVALDVQVDGRQGYDKGDEDWGRCCDKYQRIEGARSIHKELYRVSLDPRKAAKLLAMLNVRARTSSTR